MGVLALAAGAAAPAYGGVTATWGAGTAGYWNWNDAANWSTNPVYPNDGGGASYDAVVNAAGGTYSIFIPTDITLNSLTLDAAGASIGFTNSTRVEIKDLVINAGTISARSSGTATLANARMTVGPMGTLTADNGVTFDRVALTSGSTLLVAPTSTSYDGYTALVVKNDLSLENATVKTYQTTFFSGSQSINGTGMIQMGTGAYMRPALSTNGTLTIGAGITISGTGLLTSTASGAMVNRGVIQGIGSITPQFFYNYGTVSLTGTGQVRMSNSWHNLGIINVGAQATLELDGVFSPRDIGIIQTTTGLVILSGMLQNKNSTLALTGGMGQWWLSGVISGGEIASPDGSSITTLYGKNAILQDVTLGGANGPALRTGRLSRPVVAFRGTRGNTSSANR